MENTKENIIINSDNIEEKNEQNLALKASEINQENIDKNSSNNANKLSTKSKENNAISLLKSLPLLIPILCASVGLAIIVIFAIIHAGYQADGVMWLSGGAWVALILGTIACYIITILGYVAYFQNKKQRIEKIEQRKNDKKENDNNRLADRAENKMQHAKLEDFNNKLVKLQDDAILAVKVKIHIGSINRQVELVGMLKLNKTISILSLYDELFNDAVCEDNLVIKFKKARNILHASCNNLDEILDAVINGSYTIMNSNFYSEVQIDIHYKVLEFYCLLRKCKQDICTRFEKISNEGNFSNKLLLGHEDCLNDLNKLTSIYFSLITLYEDYRMALLTMSNRFLVSIDSKKELDYEIRKNNVLSQKSAKIINTDVINCTTKYTIEEMKKIMQNREKELDTVNEENSILA